MKTNMGTADRAIRAVIALALIFAAYTGKIAGTAAIGAYMVAAVLLFTAALGFCPAYLPLRLNTKK